MKQEKKTGRKRIIAGRRQFDTSIGEDKKIKFIDLVLNKGLSKIAAARMVGWKHPQDFLMPSKEQWDKICEEGEGAKVSYVRYITPFRSLHSHRAHSMVCYAIEDQIANRLATNGEGLRERIEKLNDMVKELEERADGQEQIMEEQAAIIIQQDLRIQELQSMLEEANKRKNAEDRREYSRRRYYEKQGRQVPDGKQQHKSQFEKDFDRLKAEVRMMHSALCMDDIYEI